MRKRWWQVVVFGLALAGLAVVGYWRMFTQFMAYDDEGTFLWSLSRYCAEGGLYDRVESWYGPFFFAFNHLLRLATGLEFNHDTGRLLTLIYWCGTVAVCGLISWRQTRSVWAGLAGTVLTFICLITVIREPMHPSGLLTLATALAVLAGGAAITRGRPLTFAGVVALAGTAMALSKINVGAFFVIAAGAWVAINSRAAAKGRAASLLTALACAAVPLMLMRSQWPSPWATGFVLVFACGALALTAALHAAREPEHGIRSVLVGLGAAAVFGGVVLVAATLQGTSWVGLWKGVVAAPQGFADVHYMQLRWPAGARELAIIQLLAAAAYYFRAQGAWVPAALAACRIAAGVWFFARVPLLYSEAISLQSFCFSYGPSLAWLMAVPLGSGVATGSDRARLWLAWVFLWQTLQAFPVPGSQVGWGSFLWVPLFVAGWHEALMFWAERVRVAGRAARAGAAVVLVGGALLALWPIARVGYQNFTTNEPLGLPGSTRLRLEGNLASDLRILNQNIRAHGDVLFTYPLMPSLNLWTGHRPPTVPRGAAEEYERALFNQLEADPRAVLVINRYWIELTQLQEKPQPETMFRHFNEHFAPVLKVDAFELWIRRGRQVAPLSIARLLPAVVEGRPRLEFTVEALAQPVAAIEFAQLAPERRTVQRLALDAAQSWQRLPVSEAGTANGEAVRGTGPVGIPETSRLTLEFAPVLPWPGLRDIEIRLLAADGEVLGGLRFADKPSALPLAAEREAGGQK